MRNRRTFIVLLLAIACGAVAGYSALQLLQRQPAPLQAEEPSSAAQVVVARRDLPVGHLVGEEDVRLVDWPNESVPEGYTTSVPEVVGRGLMQAVRMNEPLLDSRLAGRGAGAGLPVVVPEGMRALSIRVDEVIGVAGFIDTGTRVDVLLSIVPPADSRGDPVTRIIMQNLEVLARGQNIQRDEQGQPLIVTVVTLSVTPEQAEELTLASKFGQIHLALRNVLDVREVETPGVRMTGLLTLQRGARLPSSRPTARVAAPQVEDESQSIVIFKGGKRALIRF